MMALAYAYTTGGYETTSYAITYSPDYMVYDCYGYGGHTPEDFHVLQRNAANLACLLELIALILFIAFIPPIRPTVRIINHRISFSARIPHFDVWSGFV